MYVNVRSQEVPVLFSGCKCVPCLFPKQFFFPAPFGSPKTDFDPTLAVELGCARNRFEHQKETAAPLSASGESL